MATTEKKMMFDEEDCDVSEKEASRGVVTASLSKVLMVTVMMMLMMMLVYVVCLHVRLNKLEQHQRVCETTRNALTTNDDDEDDDDDDDNDDVYDKVRTLVSDCCIATVADTLQLAKLTSPMAVE